MNTAIHGLSRAEALAIYDAVVTYSGLRHFMDVPIKNYSSGMHMRLGFAIAANLDPDVLIVDEVLSVGDNEFQRKSMGKMREVAGEGRTVIFVSHNLNAIQRLCSRAVLLDKGRIVAEGDPEAVVGDYLGRTGGGTSEEVTIVPEEADRNGTGEARLRTVTMTDLDGNPISGVHVGQRFRVVATFEVLSEVDEAALEVGILTMEGEQVITAQNIDGDRPATRIPTGMQEIAVELSVTLMPHEFQLAIGMHRMNGRTVDHVRRIHRFTALNSNREGGDHYRWPSVRGFARAQSVWHEPRPSTDEPSEPVAQGRPRG
jgi:ABC-type glutathione transport system ATPase component